MVQEIEGSVGGQLLKNFMALRPLKYYGGIDVLAAKNWMLFVESIFELWDVVMHKKCNLPPFF